MSVSLSPVFNAYQGFSIGGIPLAGGFINTYLAGTSTPAATYTDVTGGTPNSNPIQLDASGRPNFEIWLTQGQAYKFVLTDSLGANSFTYDNITGTGDLSALAAATGASLVGWLQSGTGAVLRTVESKLRDVVSVFDFMTAAQIADYQAQTFSLDHASAVNAAIASVAASGARLELYLPAGILNLNSSITTTAAISLLGAGHAGQGTTGAAGANNGTLIRFNHLNQGFICSGSGFSARNLGVFRTQTAPGGGWTPAASNFDFDLSATDVHLESLLFWGTAKGVRINAGGRVYIRDILGQCFNNGIQVLAVTDVCRINDVHLWPVWSQNANVQSYMLANLVAMELQRADGLMVSNFFSIWANKSIRFAHNAAGDVTQGKFSNIYLDNCSMGIVAESTTNGVTAQFSNVNHQSDTTSPGNGCGIQLNGTNAVIDIANFRSDRSDISAVRNSDGTGNKLRIAHLEMTNWNQAAGAFTGCSCDGSNNEVSISGKVQLGAAASGGTAAFGGANQKSGFWHWTSGSGTTGATGLISFPHGLGFVPGSADVAIVGNNANVAKVVSIDATNVNCVVYTPTVVLNAGSVGVTLRLYY